jgi:CelD/BcsL family acetyltransferase involved in cellulose biosynthesis
MALVFHPPAIHRSAENLQAEVIRPSDMTVEELKAWADMRGADADFKSPLLSPDFALAVGRNRPDTRVAVFRRDLKLVGFLPFHARPDGQARPLGAPFSDLHALITTPDAGLEPAAALKAAGISGYRFSGLVDPFALFQNATSGTTPSFVLHVEEDPHAVLARLAERSPKRFKQYRRLERKLEREVGPLTITIGDSDRDALHSLFAWKRAQYAKNGLHDVLGPEWVQNMMYDLFEQRTGALKGCLVTLRAGGALVAAEFGPREDAAFHPWISAYNPEMAGYSPGMLLMVRMIEVMPANGMTTYDLGPSPETYKPYFASEVRQVSCGAVGANAGRIRSFINAIPNDKVRTLAERALRRMDQVASVELTAWGRARGIMRAMTAMRTRLAFPQGSAPAQAPEASAA